MVCECCHLPPPPSIIPRKPDDAPQFVAPVRNQQVFVLLAVVAVGVHSVAIGVAAPVATVVKVGLRAVRLINAKNRTSGRRIVAQIEVKCGKVFPVEDGLAVWSFDPSSVLVGALTKGHS